MLSGRWQASMMTRYLAIGAIGDRAFVRWRMARYLGVYGGMWMRRKVRRSYKPGEARGHGRSPRNAGDFAILAEVSERREMEWSHGGSSESAPMAGCVGRKRGSEVGIPGRKTGDLERSGR